MAAAAFDASRRRVAALRLAAQQIERSELASPGGVVRRLLAMQGQDFPGVKWSIGLRGAGSTEAQVDGAFEAGDIVRSWPMRGTLHVVAAEDLGWMLALTAPRATVTAGRRRDALGITAGDIERAREAAVAALAGGRALSRALLAEAFSTAGVSTAGQRGYHILWYLAQTGTLVLGPPDRGQQRFVLLDEWVRTPRILERDEALGELALRYFRGHGPATVRDLGRWSGLTTADVRRGVAVAGSALARLDVDGIAYHLAPEALAPDPATGAGSNAAGSAPGVHLLPGFDEYILGYADRTSALAPEHSRVVVPGDNGMFAPTIVVDGEVVGTWRRTLAAREVVVEARPFDGVLARPVTDGVLTAADAYGAFLGRPARLRAPDVAREA